jgi:hypothetical protein
MLRRWWSVTVLVLSLTTLSPTFAEPAAAARSGPTAFFGSPAQDVSQLTSYSYGSLVVEQGGSILMPFGTTSGSPTEIAAAAMYLPTYPGLSITSQTSACFAETGWLDCPGQQSLPVAFGEAQISTTASTPLGYAGMVTVSGSGASTSLPLWVISSSRGADMQFLTTDTVARVGQTATVTVTVINNGPSPEPYWAIGFLNMPGAQLIGLHGCSPGQLVGPIVLPDSTYPCAHLAMTPVGAVTSISFDIKVLAPHENGVVFSFLTSTGVPNPDPQSGRSNFTVVVYGGGADGPSSPAAPAPAIPVPTVAPAATPTVTVMPAAGPVAAARRAISPGHGYLWWGLGALLVLAAALGISYLRRDRARVSRMH